MSLMGVDVGSSGCKAVTFTPEGRALAEATRRYQATFGAGGRAEMDPEALWQAVAGAISAAAAGTVEPVEAVCLSSHGETFIPLAANGTPLGPAVMNADGRAAAEAGEWEQALGRARIHAITGLIVHPMYSLLKIAWLRVHDQQTFRGAARFAGVCDYLLGRLGLPPYLDYSLASRFLALDVRARQWSEELLEAAGVSTARLPTPVPAGTAAGRLSAEAAAEVGLAAGTLAVVGGHDQACAALGAGATEPGAVADSIGTYECLTAVSAAPHLEEAARAAGLESYCHVAPDRYITIAYFPSGLVVSWYCDTFCQADAEPAAARGLSLYECLESLAPEGPTGICVLPHLIGSGTPHYDPRAAGAIYGLTPGVDRGTLYKAVLEGLACELAMVADLLEAVVGPFPVVRVTGGGAQSRLGLALRAATTGRSMQTFQEKEATCLGAAILAAVAAGHYAAPAEAASQMVRPGELVSPPGDGGGYREQLARYRRLYPALAPMRRG